MSITIGGTAARLRVVASQFQVISGVRRASSDCVSSVTAGPGVAHKGSLYILSEPRANLALGLEACQLVQQVLAHEYYAESSPSATTSLTRALARANLALLQHNRQAESRQRASVGLSCAVVRGDEVYIAQLPPAQVFLIHQGSVRAFPTPRNWPGANDNPFPPASLGSTTGEPDPDLIRSPLESGDALILCSANLAGLLTPAEADRHLAGADQYAIIDYLHRLTEEHNLLEGYALALYASSDSRSRTASGSVRLPSRNTGEHPVAEKRSFDPRAMLSNLRRGGKAAQPESGYAPAPISLRSSGPAPDVTFDHTSGQDVQVVEAAATFVAPPDRQPLLDNLLAHRRDMEENASFASPASSRPPLHLVRRADYEVNKPHPDRDADEVQFTNPDYTAEPVAEEDAFFTSPTAAPDSSGNAALDRAKGVAGQLGSKLRQASGAGLAAIQNLAQRNRQQAASEPGGETPLEPAVDPHKTGAIIFDEEVQAAPAPASGLAARAAALKAQIGARFSRQPVEAASQQTGAIYRPASRTSASYQRPDYAQGQPRHLPRIPVWVLIGTLLLIAALLFFFVNQGVAAQKSQQINDYLKKASTALASANSVSDPQARRAHLKAASDNIEYAAKLDPASTEVGKARGQVQSEMDRVNLVVRFAKLDLIFDLHSHALKDGSAAPAATASFLSQIVVGGGDFYLLDRGVSTLYRCKADGTGTTVILNKGDGLVKGSLLYITWRVDRLVALDDGYNLYVYDPSSGSSTATALGASNNFNRPLDLASYDGNLYILGARSNQIVKYAGGNYGVAPTEWFSGDPGAMGGASKLAINGEVYVLTSNGSVLHLVNHQLKERSDLNAGPNAVEPPAAAPHALFASPDNKFLYAADSKGGPTNTQGGRVFKLDLSGRLIAQYMTTLSSDDLANLNSIYVTPDDSTIYLLTSDRLYRGSLLNDAPTAASVNPLATAKPTRVP